MDIQKLTKFFMWNTIINCIILIVAVIGCISFLDFCYSMHSKFFVMDRDTFNSAIYLFLGIFKIIWLTFNLIPFVSLLIIQRK